MMTWTTRPDPDFKGSIYEELGYEARICNACGAHVRNGICLNACHLPKASQERFARLMKQAAKR